ncbi:MAG: hypothetical protein ACT4NL_14475 [Pseudomarimonas sp.]
MWHPLKNTLYSLSLVTVALVTLLALGEPVANATSHADAPTRAEQGFVQSVDALSAHLPIDDAAEKALAVAAVRIAARVIQAEVNTRSEDTAKVAQKSSPPRARRQSTMPFFSFANLLPRTKEPGA